MRKNKKVRKVFIRGSFITGVLFLLLSNIWVAYANNDQLYDDIQETPSKEYALVLGTSKKGIYGTNLYFKYRMEAAAELYLNNKVDSIIVSGDNHVVTYDEASDMENYLVELGVPRGVIIKDYAGFRTLDSVVRAKKVFNCNSLIIVSQEFHNKRAIFIANHYNIDAVAYNARDLQRRLGKFHWREFFARPLMILDLYLLKSEPKFL